MILKVHVSLGMHDITEEVELSDEALKDQLQAER